ncbi:hypothetical protein [Methylobacterium trifolii]|uniref:Uncharacterized protein n=1 Tax=Methylobacterium trifolii TaxID=1003092 RepID=A0ABQ4U6B0_9HYPH|nr:hypothetical protein [Methylobacterium trifolii]GJE61942.1 hypothetical protein MPOCJGCO_4070 [Methylobacterium trifolii]
MKLVLAASLVAIGLLSGAPASAQSIGIGPDGPNIDLRSRGQRERDMDREEARRENRRDMRREQRRRDMEDDDDRPRRRY